MKSRRFTRQLAMYAAALLLLAGGGALLGVVTTGIHSKQEQNGLQPEPPHIDRTDALSQQLAFLSLGGLRSLVAEVLTLDATDAWLKQDWPRLHRRWDAAVTLAPHRLNYWLNAAYDMTNNAAGYLAEDTKLPHAERMAEARKYIGYGEQFLLKGIANNPTSWRLYLGLAEQYGNLYRRPQFSKAAEALQQALQHGAPSYYKRFRFYHLCRVRGAEREAWQLGRELFIDEDNRQPSLLFLLFVLQHKLEIPANEALSVDTLYRRSPEESAHEVLERALDDMNHMLNNDLLYPVNGVAEFLKQHEAE